MDLIDGVAHVFLVHIDVFELFNDLALDVTSFILTLSNELFKLGVFIPSLRGFT